MRNLREAGFCQKIVVRTLAASANVQEIVIESYTQIGRLILIRVMVAVDFRHKSGNLFGTVGVAERWPHANRASEQSRP